MNSECFRRSLLLALVWMVSLAVICPSFADVTLVKEPSKTGEIQVFKITLSPAPLPTPFLKYRLTVEPHKTIAANAITHYLRSYGENQLHRPFEAAAKEYGNFEEMYGFDPPSKNLSLEDLRGASAMFDSYVDNYIARATLCRYADWGLAEEDLTGQEALNFLLPSVNQTRMISHVLVLRTRLAIAEGRYEDAVAHMRMNYQLGQNVEKMKFLIADLVAMAEIFMTHNTMIEFIAAPNSPNMYWALAELPYPMINIRDSLRLEMSLGVRMNPELMDIETANHSKEEWALLTESTFKKMMVIISPDQKKQNENVYSNLQLLAIAMSSYPTAKSRLVESGVDREQVEAMAVGHVLLLDMIRELKRYSDLIETTTLMPAAQSIKFGRDVEDELQQAVDKMELGAIMYSTIFPATEQVRLGQSRVESQRRILQVIEAIRLHLAETGKLPRSLDEITSVPIPSDEFTGEPFPYSCDGTTAILELAKCGGYGGMRFEIQIAKPATSTDILAPPHPPTPSPREFGESWIKWRSDFVRIHGARGSK